MALRLLPDYAFAWRNLYDICRLCLFLSACRFAMINKFSSRAFFIKSACVWFVAGPVSLYRAVSSADKICGVLSCAKLYIAFKFINFRARFRTVSAGVNLHKPNLPLNAQDGNANFARSARNTRNLAAGFKFVARDAACRFDFLFDTRKYRLNLRD